MTHLSMIISLAIVAGQLIKMPFGTYGGVTLLDLAIITLCIIGLIKIKFNFKKPPRFITAAFIFTLVAIISLVLTPLHLNLEEYAISFFYTIRFSSYLLFAWLIYSEAFGNFKQYLNNALLYSGIGLAILGLLQFIFLPDLSFLTKFGWDPHYFRTVSTFLDPNFAGAYFVLTLALLSHLSHLGGVLDRTPRNLGIFVTYLALLTTFSRGSYLMFLISGLTLSFLEKSKKILIKTIIAFLVLLLGFQVYTQLVSKPRNISREKSASYRLNTWQQGWQLFNLHPILGIGFNAYRFGIREYNLGDEKFLQSHGSSTNDSSLLYVAATTGVGGLIIYLYFLYCLLKYANNRNIISAAVLGLIVHSFFANSLFFPPILLWLLLTSQIPKK